MLKRSLDKRFAWIPGVAAAATVLALGAFVMPGATDRLENFVYDRALRMEGAMPPSDLTIVAIDEESLSRLGAWPWSNGVHAQLLERLHAAGAGLVAFTMPLVDSQSDAGLQQLRAAIDLLQSEQIGKSAESEQLKRMLDSSVATLDQTTMLANAIAKHNRVFLAVEAKMGASSDAISSERLAALDIESSFLRADPVVVPLAPTASDLQFPAPAIGAQVRGYGHSYYAPDSDEVLRSYVAAIRVGDKLLPSLSLVASANMAGISPTQVTLNDDALLTLGNVRLQLDEGLRWRPAFFPSAGKRAVRRVSYWRVLRGEIPAEDLRDKTVLIGFTDRTSAMGALQYATPLGERATPVELIANSVSSFRQDLSYSHPGWAVGLQWLISLGVLALAAWRLPTFKMSLTAVTTTLGALALVGFEIGLLSIVGVWVKLTLPALMLFGALVALGGLRYMKHLHSPQGQGADAVESLRMLGLTFQGQGQLDLAYETFRRCPTDTQSLTLLYGIGQDYERRRQFNKAADVYAHIASVDAAYKDAVQRRDRMRRTDVAQGAHAKGAARPGVRKGEYADPPTIPVPLSNASRKQTLGRYEIERELGKGAMGVVYLGRDPKINRVVAIKAIALAEEFAEEDLADARARFFREAEMAGRLNHPGIVTVYDAGEDRGLAFIAMEYLRGEHLSHFAEPIYLLPVPRVLSLAARVAEALDYAHKQNVVHRDIKPANIMFNKDSDELKITDFGIARLTDTSRTKTGIVLGTPSFMSPEQLEGRPLDGRSDLFALGVALYQLLTGQLPFRADSMTRLMQKIATEPHVPLNSLRPELPDMAEQIMVRSLAKSANDRYQTGAEMAAALRACIRLASRKEALAR